MRPSLFDTIFCATASTSPFAQRLALGLDRARDERGEIIAGVDLGKSVERGDGQ